MNIDTGVFERRDGDTVSDNLFYGILAAALVWGFAVTAGLARYTASIGFQPGLGLVLLLGLGLPILGIVIAHKSDNPVISFLGYNLLVAPYGIILGPVLNQYSPNVVMHAAMLTGGISVFMGTAGVMFPNIFRNLGGALFAALIGVVIARIAQLFIPAMAAMTWIDYAAALVFALYIGYDMWRASEIGKTVDNAIDVAVALYLDILNLFLTILRIMGEKK